MKITLEIQTENSASTRVFLDDVEVSQALTAVSARADLESARVTLTRHVHIASISLSDDQRAALERFDALPEPETVPASLEAEAMKLGVAMRECQRTYFLTRKKEDLIASKQAESKFDAAAKQLLEGALE